MDRWSAGPKLVVKATATLNPKITRKVLKAHPFGAVPIHGTAAKIFKTPGSPLSGPWAREDFQSLFIMIITQRREIKGQVDWGMGTAGWGRRKAGS
jgi:hypothetical protein